MAENDDADRALAQAEIARDDSVRNLLGGETTPVERASALKITQNRTLQLDQAARQVQPPQRKT